MSGDEKPRPVDPSLYDEEYFLSECEGHEQFVVTGGKTLSRRLVTALTHIDVRPGVRVLDVGCGRGEALIWATRQGARAWGLDYAPKALDLASSAIEAVDLSRYPSPRLVASNACQLPVSSGSFQYVLMIDIVEHLHDWELNQALREARRVLEPGGKLVVHTAPNLWYYRFGYPFFRLFMRLQGEELPKDPRERFRYHKYVHVNEQSPRSLARALRKAGFRAQVWLEDTQRRWAERNGVTHLMGWAATHCYPFRLVFCGDVLAIGHKGQEA